MPTTSSTGASGAVTGAVVPADRVAAEMRARAEPRMEKRLVEDMEMKGCARMMRRDFDRASGFFVGFSKQVDICFGVLNGKRFASPNGNGFQVF